MLLPRWLTVAALVWAITLVVAPRALTSGKPVLVSAAATVYAGASLICHQRAARSFHLAGVQLPVCARCAGLYLSGACGALLAWVLSRHPRVPSHTRRTLMIASAPTALSLVLEWSGVFDPGNLGRFLSALPLGASAAWIFVQSLRAEARPHPSHKSRITDPRTVA